MPTKAVGGDHLRKKARNWKKACCSGMCMIALYYGVQMAPGSFWSFFWLQVPYFFPVGYYENHEKIEENYSLQVESYFDHKAVLAEEAADENYINEDTGELVKTAQKVEPTEPEQQAPAVTFSVEKLNDFDYLIQNFYRVDATTTIDGSQLNAQNMLQQDMHLAPNVDGPQILIYHTHASEAFEGDPATTKTVVDVGNELTRLLQEKYQLHVMHDSTVFDEDRDHAYAKAAPALEKLLQENPSIEVVIDLHRDGVDPQTHLVTQVNGKTTAQIMFFNGLCRTNAGPISYLPNENLASNLAFSFQMQLKANEYYPGFSRCVYLKGYRYNMQYRPKTLLVEVGAQTNTSMEAENAMEPLADILAKVVKMQADE